MGAIVVLVLVQIALVWLGPVGRQAGQPEMSRIRIAEFSLTPSRDWALARLTTVQRGRLPAQHRLFVHRTDGVSEPFPLFEDRPGIHAAAISGDAMRVAVATIGNEVLVLHRNDTRRAAMRIDRVFPDFIDQFCWTPGGGHLIGSGSEYLYVWGASDYRRLHRLAHGAGPTRWLQAPIDDPEHVYLFTHGRCSVWDVHRGRCSEVIELPDDAGVFAPSSDCRFVILGRSRSLSAWDLRRGQPLWQQDAVTYSVPRDSVSVSPDDALVASLHPGVQGNGQIIVRRCDNGHRVTAFRAGVGRVTGIGFVSPSLLWVWGYQGVIEARQLPSGRQLWQLDLTRR